MAVTIPSVLAGWSQQDLSNLGQLLGLEGVADVDGITLQFKWLYYSKARARSEALAKTAWQRLLRRDDPQPNDTDSLRESPSYETLIQGACKHMRAAEAGATLQELELYLSLAVIVSALAAMSSRQRLTFFQTPIDPSLVARGASIKGAGVGGPASTLATLGVAQASGFGTYLAATTALGFLTHAVGLTLPFVVYTGLTSTIAFVIGPAGWLSAGLWGAWKLTGPNWPKIIPALVYIVATNSRKKNAESQVD